MSARKEASCVCDSVASQAAPPESGDTTHIKQVLEGINKLRLNNDLIDLIITVGDKEFPAHKVVFASLCPAYLTKATTPSGNGRCSVSNVKPDIFKLVLDFAYTGNISLTENNVEPIWFAAACLQAALLITACETFIKKNINFQNCFKFYSFGVDKNIQGIKKMASDFIERNFSAVAEQEGFVKLPVERVIDIIKSDSLETRGEEEVYKAVMRWIQAKEERKKYLLQLLQNVRLAELPPEFFHVHINLNADVMRSSECMRLVNRVLMHKLKPEPQSELLCFRPRLSSSYVEGVFIMGTRNDGSTHMALMMVENGKLLDIKSPPFPSKTIVASVSLNQSVYLMNCLYEVSERKYTSKLWCLESDTGDWRELEGPVAEKKYTGLVELNGLLYAIGGGPGNVVERFDPSKNCWTFAAPLPVKVYFPTIVTLNGKIYVLGGTISQPQAGKKSEKDVSDAVQRYDPASNSWAKLSPLCLRTKRLLACTFNNKIFIMDGCLKNPSPSKAVYFLDISTDKWVPGPDLKKAYSNPGILTLFNGQLTVFDTTRLPELDFESMALSGSWEVPRKQISVHSFKTITRMFGGGVKVRPH